MIWSSKWQRRPMLLLEILIAFSLVMLCAFPLLYPHFYMVRAEKEALYTIELDRVVGTIYAEVVTKLYRNQIPWKEIKADGTRYAISHLGLSDSVMQQLARTHYTGQYFFETLDYAPKKEPNEVTGGPSHHHVRITFAFTPTGVLRAKPIQFQRSVYIQRQVPIGAQG